MSNNLRQAAQQALEALENAYMVNSWAWVDQKKQVITALRAALAEPDYWQEEARRYAGNADYWRKRYKALAEPEQTPVAWISEGGDVSRSKRYMDEMGFKCEPLYTAPPQREHITNGSPCWCNPDVIEEDGGNVIVHNYDDNWQQYAKPGETAQQCIERHRAEQDALMKLYATPRKPLTDEELRECWDQVGNNETVWAMRVQFARAIERAHGIGEQHE